MTEKIKGILRRGIFLAVVFFIVFFILIRPIAIRYYQNKYDASYNIERRKLGLPIIPANWKITQRSDKGAYWCDNEYVLGHKRKYVAFDGRNSILELDVYNLPVQRGKQRWLELQYRYPTDTSKAKYLYSYQIDHEAKTITKAVADSLLVAEKINPDK